MKKKGGNQKYIYLVFTLLIALFAVVFPKPYLTYPGFIVYGFEEFEKNRKECLGYSIEIRRELQPADDPEYSLCFGMLIPQRDNSSTPTQPTTTESTATPLVDTNTPTVFPTSSIRPTIKPLATKKPVKPTPTPVTGVDMRFHELHFYRHPDPMVGYTPFRVANGGSITVPNEKNVSEFELFVWFVNQGTEESKSKNIWVDYFVDGVEVKHSLANLPDNMVAEDLMIRGAAQPVPIPASGTHTVKIVIDQENQSNDVNQTNNTYTFTYTVQ